MNPPYPEDTRAKGWRFELDHERIRQSDTWALASPEHRPWLLMLWMVAWEQTPCGSLPDDDELIAARIGMAPKPFAKARAALLRGWEPADDGRLYQGFITQLVLEMLAVKSGETKRKAEWRAKNAMSHGTDAGQTRDEPPVTRESATGTGTREEKEKRESARGTRLPPDWIPGEKGLAYAAKEGLANGSVARELENFRDHWIAKAGKDAVKTDWSATWRLWVRRSKDYVKPGQVQAGEKPWDGAQ